MPTRRIGLALLPLLASALDNGLARNPPRGFNPWNVFGHNARGECKLPVPWVPGGCRVFTESLVPPLRSCAENGSFNTGCRWMRW
jgi:hypothetical protein